MENELWKPILLPVDLGGRYEISNMGRVKRCSYTTKTFKIYKESLILRPHYPDKKYAKVHINHNGKAVNLSIHRLVCFAFHENPENKRQVNHINANKHDNRAENLEWCTGSENIRHAQSLGIYPYAKVKIKLPKKKNPPRYKPIVNIDTGEKFSGVNILSEKLGISKNSLRKRLCGQWVNNLPFRYIGQEDVKKEYKGSRKYCVAVFDTEWNLLKELNNSKELCEFIGSKNVKPVLRFVNGENSAYKGFKFKRMREDGSYIEPVAFISKKPPLKPKKPKGDVIRKPVQKIDDNGIVVGHFKSMYAAAQSIGIDSNRFRKCIKKSPRNYYKGFIWKFA